MLISYKQSSNVVTAQMGRAGWDWQYGVAGRELVRKAIRELAGFHIWRSTRGATLLAGRCRGAPSQTSATAALLRLLLPVACLQPSASVLATPLVYNLSRPHLHVCTSAHHSEHSAPVPPSTSCLLRAAAAASVGDAQVQSRSIPQPTPACPSYRSFTLPAAHNPPRPFGVRPARAPCPSPITACGARAVSLDCRPRCLGTDSADAR